MTSETTKFSHERQTKAAGQARTPDDLPAPERAQAAADEPEDEVEEASKDSFPASDPPAWTLVTGVRSPIDESTG